MLLAQLAGQLGQQSHNTLANTLKVLSMTTKTAQLIPPTNRNGKHHNGKKQTHQRKNRYC
jgi:hypothetical protein